MKRKILLILFILLLFPITVYADKVYDINMHINILEDGSADITEKWTVKADDGSEWYKQMYNLKNMEITNFTVAMDNTKLKEKNWNINESLSEKSGYYGINYTSEGIELCFGKSDFKKHVFTLNYHLSNFIFNTNDAQAMYFTMIPNGTLDTFNVEITSYYNFPDNLDVWGYGYKGYAYVQNGKATFTTDYSLNNEYVVGLIKFPLNTFNTTNAYYDYETFDDILNKAKEGSYEHDYTYVEKTSTYEDIISFILSTFPFIIFTVLSGLIVKKSKESGYGYINDKKIDKNNTNNFRDIPCNKDIYYANALIKLNNFGYKETNIFGAILLKWVRENKIVFKNEKKGLFNKETSSIDLSLNPSFDNELEKDLFNILYDASGDGILETKELEKWAKNHYTKFFSIFEKLSNRKINELKNSNHIYSRKNKEECKKKMVMDDTIYEESKKLFGLKLFLEEFSDIKTKEVIEVHLWDEYLMFAYLFGIADKVAKQLKDLYPEINTEMENAHVDYNMIIFMNNISRAGYNAASSARIAASNYSGGGGGFSSGGGGGGSSGGGGSFGGR